MNKVLIIAIAVISISISAQIGFAVPTISVEPSYQSVSCGDTFTVNITVDPDGNTITGVAYILCFNNTLLNATSLVSGAFFSGFSVNIYGEGINNSAGTIDYCESIIGDGGVTGIGTLTTIAFEAIRPGVSNLNFSVVTVVNDTGATDVEIADGTVDIAQSQPPTSFLISGYISYADGSDCNDPKVNITNLNIGKEWTAETYETFNYYQLALLSCADVIAGEVLRFDAASPDGSQSRITEHTVTQSEVDGGGFELNITLEYRPGDVNGDGRITPADVAIALQMAVRGEYSKMADVSDDNSVTSLDALMILQEVDEDIT